MHFFSIDMVQMTPPPPAPAPHRKASIAGMDPSVPDIQAALKDIRTTLKRTKTYPSQQDNHLLSEAIPSPISTSPVWIPRLVLNTFSLILGQFLMYMYVH